jgi:DegV family protein with EDD domain
VVPELEMDVGMFYARLGADDELPTTAPPEVEDFVHVYEPLLAEGRSVVSIHISSGLSDTCDKARAAAARLAQAGNGGNRIEVVDSATGAGALALLTLVAAAAAQDGDDSAAIVERVRVARQTLKNRLVLDTLEFLHRGGRIGGAAAWLGSRLQVKPVLTAESEIRAVERVRTTERGFDRLVEFAQTLHSERAELWMVQHAGAPDVARRLTDRLQRVFRRPPAFVSQFPPTMGTHVGPGALMLAGIADHRATP